MKLFDIAFKDLSQILRDWRSLIFLVAMPLVFTFFMGFAYQNGEPDPTQEAGLPLAWVLTGKSSPMSDALYERLAANPAVALQSMTESDAMQALRNKTLAGVLLVPDALDADGQLKLLAESGSVEGQALYQYLRDPLTQLMSAAEIARLNAELLEDPQEYETSFNLAWQQWAEVSTSDYIRHDVAVTAAVESWYGTNPYNQASPGILVQFAIMGLITPAGIILTERKSGTLQRLKTTALQGWHIVGGHLMGMFLLVFGQTMLLVIFGQLVLGVDYLREPLAILLMCIALSLWVASMGLLIGMAAKSDDQVVLFSLITMFVLSGVGGLWFPLEVAGPIFGIIGNALPSGLAMAGIQNILIRGQGLASIWLPAAGLLGFAAAFFAAAAWQFRRIF